MAFKDEVRHEKEGQMFPLVTNTGTYSYLGYFLLAATFCPMLDVALTALRRIRC